MKRIRTSTNITFERIGPAQVQRVCAQCGRTFYHYINKTHKNLRSYCSVICKKRAHQSPPRFCERCKAPIDNKPKRQRFCSIKCALITRNQTPRQIALSHPKGQHHTEETKRRISEKCKGRKGSWQGKHRDEATKSKLRIARLGQVMVRASTKIEISVQGVLKRCGIEYQSNISIEGIAIPDQVIMDRKIAIFENGCYWHGCKICGFDNPTKRAKDIAIDNKLKSRGWTVIWLWEHDIKKNPSFIERTLMSLKV